MGILQASIQEGRSATLEDSRNADLVQRCLEQMKSLLTNATELESKYGMQQIVHTSPLWEPPSNRNLISLNSMNIFRTSYRRFWVRYGNEANRPSLLAKTRWAIHDKLKFETLIVNLRELIDGLNQIVPVSKESQDRILQDDIASIPDRSRLKIIQSACEESYAGLSDVASTVAAESEIGTIDGWLRNTQMGDLEDVDSIRLENGQQAVFSLDQYLAQMYTPKRAIQALSDGSKWEWINICFIVTGTCLGVQSQSPCNSDNLAKRSFDWSQNYCFTPKANHASPWVLNRRISRLVDLSSFHYDLQSFLNPKPPDEFAAGNLGDLSSDLVNAQLPLARIYVYCAPCASAISTAIALCQESP